MRRWIVHLQLHVHLLHHLRRRCVQNQHVDAADAHRVPVGRRCSKGERDQLIRYNEHRTDEAWRERRYSGNAESIDGLPGLVKPDAAE